MGLVSILLTSFALSMDAFAVSVTKGIIIKNITKKIAFKIAFFFGLFQGGMPLIGWALGIRFEKYIKSFDHWIALLLLSFLGARMIYESIQDRKEYNDNKMNEIALDMDTNGNRKKSINYTISMKDLIVLSIATSVDALAVGVSFAFLSINIIPVVTSIALITFIVCFIGVLIGSQIGYRLKDYAEIVGGIILIFIGFSIFNEHTGFITKIF